MRKIEIVFTKSRKKFPILSWLIRLIWNTEYSHTAIVFHSNKYNTDLVYQASATGLNFMAKHLFDKEHEIVYQESIEIDEKTHDLIIKNCINRSGYKYGTLQSIGVGLVYLFGKYNIKIKNPFSDGQTKWICSEWVAETLSLIYDDYKPDLETVSPKDVYDYLKTRNN